MFLEKVSNIVHFGSYHLSWSLNYFHLFIFLFSLETEVEA